MQNMDFSPHGVNQLDCLQSPFFSPSALSPVDVLYLDDSDKHHYGHGDVVLVAGDDEPVVSPSMVSQTIEPSQLADFSPSPSRSPTPYYASPYSPASSATSYSSDSGEESPAPKSRRGRKPKSLNSPKEHYHDHVQADEPYPSGSDPRVKRHQTKLACIWCRKLSKKCDTQRPCGRCVQFNRCSECVDAPPRKPRAKGVDRGTYKKRDTATPEFQESAFVAKSKVRKSVKGGRGAGSPENCMRKGFVGSDGVVNDKVGMDLNPLLSPMSGGIVPTATAASTDQGSLAPIVGSVACPALSLQGGSLPFTGPLEDLFTCSASPQMDGLVISSPSLFDESSSYPSSPEAESDTPLFFDTPATSDLSVDDYDFLVYQALDYYPSIMKLLNDYADAARQSSFDPDEFQRLSDIALKA